MFPLLLLFPMVNQKNTETAQLGKGNVSSAPNEFRGYKGYFAEISGGQQAITHHAGAHGVETAILHRKPSTSP